MQNCTKCGKEIPDGENKICDECKNSLLTDLGNENNNSKFEINKKSTKTENKPKKSKKILYFIIPIIIICIICVGIVLKINGIIFSNNSKVGVSIGNNNNNYGYANIKGNWIYYMTLSEDASKININKVDKNGKSKSALVQKDWEIYSINIYKKYLYFIAIEPTEDEDTYRNNKIYKMSLDGKELTVINDNDFSDDCENIYVTNDRVFYIGDKYNVYSMDLNGEDKKIVSENETGYIGITDKYIFYNDYPENPESETDYVTYIMNLDGTDAKVINGKRLYNPNIVGNDIYYVNGDNSEIHKIGVDGKNDTLVYKSPAYNMNVSDGYIYYLNYKNEDADSEDEPVCIHRVKLDGTGHEIICEMENYSSFIDIVGDWIYYTDHNDEKYFIKLTKVDGSEDIVLYEYGMNVPTNTVTEDTSNPSSETTTNTVDEGSNVDNTVSNSVSTNTTATNNTSVNKVESNNTTSNNTVGNN